MSKFFSSLIAIIEIGIGVITLGGVAVVQATGVYGIGPKPMNLYLFVVISACTSFVLGVGLLFKREWARSLLIFFSGYVILTKILRYAGLMTFDGEIIRTIPSWTKDAISFFYHAAIILFLSFQRPKR